MSLTIISRAQWGAVHDRGSGSRPLPAAEAWLHHSVALMPDLEWVDADRDGVEDDEERAMRALESIGEARFGRGISYTWVVAPSGRVYEGHGVDRIGSHTAGRNTRAMAICLMGNYEVHEPTGLQLAAVAELLRRNVTNGWLRFPKLNGGHRDVKGTACPGIKAYRRVYDVNRMAASGVYDLRAPDGTQTPTPVAPVPSPPSPAQGPGGSRLLAVDGIWGKRSQQRFQESLNRTGARPPLDQDGWVRVEDGLVRDVGRATARAVRARLHHFDRSIPLEGGFDRYLVQRIQGHAGLSSDWRRLNGLWGPNTSGALQRLLNEREF